MGREPVYADLTKRISKIRLLSMRTSGITNCRDKSNYGKHISDTRHKCAFIKSIIKRLHVKKVISDHCQ